MPTIPTPSSPPDDFDPAVRADIDQALAVAAQAGSPPARFTERDAADLVALYGPDHPAPRHARRQAERSQRTGLGAVLVMIVAALSGVVVCGLVALIFTAWVAPTPAMASDALPSSSRYARETPCATPTSTTATTPSPASSITAAPITTPSAIPTPSTSPSPSPELAATPGPSSSPNPTSLPTSRPSVSPSSTPTAQVTPSPAVTPTARSSAPWPTTAPPAHSPLPERSEVSAAPLELAATGLDEGVLWWVAAVGLALLGVGWQIVLWVRDERRRGDR